MKRAITKDQTVRMRVTSGWIAVVDDWRVTQRPVLSRSSAIAALVLVGVEHVSFLPKTLTKETTS